MLRTCLTCRSCAPSILNSQICLDPGRYANQDVCQKAVRTIFQRLESGCGGVSRADCKLIFNMQKSSLRSLVDFEQMQLRACRVDGCLQSFCLGERICVMLCLQNCSFAFRLCVQLSISEAEGLLRHVSPVAHLQTCLPAGSCWT